MRTLRRTRNALHGAYVTFTLKLEWNKRFVFTFKKHNIDLNEVKGNMVLFYREGYEFLSEKIWQWFKGKNSPKNKVN